MNKDTVFLLIIIFLVTSVYVAYKKLMKNSEYLEYEKLKLHLLNKSNLATIKKPILWIPIPFEYNSRKWESFGSRTSNELNMDILYLTVKTTVEHCGQSFHIVLIDDTSYGKLLPGWNVDHSKLPSPLKEQMSFLAQMKLIYYYGGMVIPASFVCTNDLYNLYYDTCVYKKDISFINLSSGKPSVSFISTYKNNSNMKNILNELEYIISRNNTDSVWFDKEINKVFQSHAKELPGCHVGIYDKSKNIITIDQLMEEKGLELCDTSFGLYVPLCQLKNRTMYNWMIYLDHAEIMQTNNAIVDLIRKNI